jgi:hypothetical protein
MEIVSPCREQLRRVNYGAIFEIKREISGSDTLAVGREVKKEIPA